MWCARCCLSATPDECVVLPLVTYFCLQLDEICWIALRCAVLCHPSYLSTHGATERRCWVLIGPRLYRDLLPEGACTGSSATANNLADLLKARGNAAVGYLV